MRRYLLICVACGSFASEAQAASKAPALSPRAALERAFSDSYFEEAEPLARALSDDPGASPADRERALDLLWRIEFYLGKANAAAVTLARLLERQPQMTLDPAQNPPPLVEFFNQQRARSAKRIEPKADEKKVVAETPVRASSRVAALRAGGIAALVIGSAALASGVATFVAAQVLAPAINPDIALYNNDPARPPAQERALYARIQQIDALDASTIALGVAAAAGIGVGIALLVVAKPEPEKATVRLTDFSIGPGTLALSGRFDL